MQLVWLEQWQEGQEGPAHGTLETVRRASPTHCGVSEWHLTAGSVWLLSSDTGEAGRPVKYCNNPDEAWWELGPGMAAVEVGRCIWIQDIF